MLGSPIRNIGHLPIKTIFLTFDDGPCPGTTDRILRILEKRNAKASFFVIADRARQEPKLLSEICSQGHAIGNHSLDHGYSAFFAGRDTILNWVRRSEDLLVKLTGAPTVGFRPPAGVRTPKLAWALDELGIPMILWSWRFYDKVLPWTTRRATGALSKIRGGDIVILHDQKSVKELPLFLEAMDSFIVQAQQQGFTFAPLRRDICARSF